MELLDCGLCDGLNTTDAIGVLPLDTADCLPIRVLLSGSRSCAATNVSENALPVRGHCPKMGSVEIQIHCSGAGEGLQRTIYKGSACHSKRQYAKVRMDSA